MYRRVRTCVGPKQVGQQRRIMKGAYKSQSTRSANQRATDCLLAMNLGVELAGIAMRKGQVDSNSFSRIQAALRKRLLVVIRGTTLTPPELITFGSQFGKLEMNSPHAMTCACPQIFPVSNDFAYGFPNAGLFWHNDGTSRKQPPRLSILHGIHTPHGGGDTLFYNMNALYSSYSAEDKKRLRSLVSVYGRSVVHGLVRQDSKSRRLAIYLALGVYKKMRGLGEDVRAAMVSNFFFRMQQDTSALYCHHWRTGDLVIWNNDCVVHRATEPPSALRLLYRVTVK